MMCFECKGIGPLVVAAVDIDGVPQIYAHQKCIDNREAEITKSMGLCR